LFCDQRRNAAFIREANERELSGSRRWSNAGARGAYSALVNSLACRFHTIPGQELLTDELFLIEHERFFRFCWIATVRYRQSVRDRWMWLWILGFLLAGHVVALAAIIALIESLFT
jgi:hypothetical protein